jgi:tetratricopeptide (TPR) repeat protein
MQDIRAFVGHSFTDDDTQVVATFLKYFEQLSELHPTFSWEHAEKAEPKILTEKVLRIIEDKNVFIGICTRKEQAIPEASLSNVMLQPLYAKAKRTDFRSKTSDWIIQEIGMAIGRGLDLILLVEGGVSDPGGLQGDVEYIRFQRDSPEKSFGKILEMITALSPKGPVEQTASPDTSPPEQKDSPKNFDSDFKNPTPSWTRDHYETSIVHLTLLNDEAGVQRVYDAYLATSESSSGDNTTTWQAHREYARLYMGRGGNLDRLKRLSDNNPQNPTMLGYLARVYSMYDRYQEAAKKYIAAAEATADFEQQTRYLQAAAHAYVACGDFPQARSLAETIRLTVTKAPSNEILLVQTLRNIFQAEQNDDAALAALERIVELRPDDFDSRSNLAYKHNENGNKDLALHHYLQIPYQERTAISWNNLGVSFSEFKLGAKCVQAYRRAEAMGDTLAMSNLGNALVSAGFVKEAKEQCNKALATEAPHKNVSELLARLARLPDEEDDKQKEILKNSEPKIKFYNRLGRASTASKPKSIGFSWQGPDCVLILALDDQTMKLTGIYERDANPFLLSGLLTSTKREKYQIQYATTVKGRAFLALCGVKARKKR